MISWVAMDRVVEEERAKDPAYRKQSAGKVLRSDARRLSDEELLAKLRSFGIELDRPSLERLCDQALSAEEIAQPLLDQRTFHGRREKMESDWIWISLCALWERWFPDKPYFEALDDKMQAGYQLQASGAAKACRIWLEAWADVRHILDKAGMQSIEEFDERFGGTQSLFNWIQDLQDELRTAGAKDRQFLKARIAFCEEGLRRFPSDDLMTENRRRALAESYFELGDTDKAESLFRGWLEADPGWGWGWIGWSDCYQFTCSQAQDWNRCEQILREGLAVADVRDRADIVDRLAGACEGQGRREEAGEWRRKAKQIAASARVSHSTSAAGNVLSQKTTIDFGDEGLPLSELPRLATSLRETSAPLSKKVGRNEPCPCGSGKKFKKCCGA